MKMYAKIYRVDFQKKKLISIDPEVEITNPKQEAVQNLLQNGKVALMILPKKGGVSLPHSLMNLDSVRIDVSHSFDTKDLYIDEDRIECTLSFGGSPFKTIIPWTAVYAASMADNLEDGVRWES